ncbi:hypothetical protein [Paenibacillus albus]|uniref:Uncharacterized protein n=1 Tax=Paenibacillus albus TaxID=2495582 RepID=A0A3Q8X784_9BACL|nr:hypothetical protein [Paenibacillus albus]AZN40472.1 hypothetical protein EJC50_13005 [Paenibacillus albus]
MKSLIELLFSNIYIVVIFVGFVLTMINKARGKQNPTNRMPSFGGEQARRQQQEGAPVEVREKNAQQSERRQEQSARPAQLRPMSPPAAVDTPAGVYKTQMKPRGEMIPSQPETEPGTLQRALAAERPAAETGGRQAGAKRQQEAQLPQRTQGGTAFRTPQGEELRRAFVMAEVLGPPRSKRSLRRM